MIDFIVEQLVSKTREYVNDKGFNLKTHTCIFVDKKTVVENIPLFDIEQTGFTIKLITKNQYNQKIYGMVGTDEVFDEQELLFKIYEELAKYEW